MKSTLKTAAVTDFIISKVSAIGLVVLLFLILQLTPPILSYCINILPTRANYDVFSPVSLRTIFSKSDND